MFSRVAVLYDIHGNLPALEAVLLEVDEWGADALVVGGDVAPGPMAAECLRRLLDCPLQKMFIRGNGDREVCSLARGGDGDSIPEPYRAASRWVAEQLTEEEIVLMESWPLTERCVIEGLGRVLFCHATARDDNELITVRTPDAELAAVFGGVFGDEFGDQSARLAVCGHTHMQFDRPLGEARVVNAGSVGMPFGRAGAYWLSLSGGVELRRTAYDFEVAAQRVKATGYPMAEDFALNNVLTCPKEDEMVALFEAARAAKG